MAHFFHVDPRVVLGLEAPDFLLWEQEAWAIVAAQEAAMEEARER